MSEKCKKTGNLFQSTALNEKRTFFYQNAVDIIESTDAINKNSYLDFLGSFFKDMKNAHSGIKKIKRKSFSNSMDIKNIGNIKKVMNKSLNSNINGNTNHVKKNIISNTDNNFMKNKKMLSHKNSFNNVLKSSVRDFRNEAMHISHFRDKSYHIKPANNSNNINIINNLNVSSNKIDDSYISYNDNINSNGLRSIRSDNKFNTNSNFNSKETPQLYL